MLYTPKLPSPQVLCRDISDRQANCNKHRKHRITSLTPICFLILTSRSPTSMQHKSEYIHISLDSNYHIFTFRHSPSQHPTPLPPQTQPKDDPSSTNLLSSTPSIFSSTQHSDIFFPHPSTFHILSPTRLQEGAATLVIDIRWLQERVRIPSSDGVKKGLITLIRWLQDGVAALIRWLQDGVAALIRWLQDRANDPNPMASRKSRSPNPGSVASREGPHTLIRWRQERAHYPNPMASRKGCDSNPMASRKG